MFGHAFGDKVRNLQNIKLNVVIQTMGRIMDVHVKVGDLKFVGIHINSYDILLGLDSLIKWHHCKCGTLFNSNVTWVGINVQSLPLPMVNVLRRMSKKLN
jgi:hypothetical protein